jgi:branched-chain amino acid aminotransferase
MQAYEGMKGMNNSFHILSRHGSALEATQKLISIQTLLAIRDSSGQIRLFRPDQHAARFRHSCDCVSIPPITDEHFIRCISLAVSLNAEFVPPNGAPAMLYVRPLALGTGAQVNIIPPTAFTFCVFVLPSAALLGVSAPVAALVLDEFDRAAPRGTGSAKVGGNYAPVMRWQRSAKEEGYAITLHLDSQTRSLIEEFSVAGFIGVYKKSESEYKLVVPDSQSVIKSVTSDTCLELARDMGWEVEVRPVCFFTDVS